jgi:pimeloyl-ACP methyl ester carboxylesterase
MYECADRAAHVHGAAGMLTDVPSPSSQQSAHDAYGPVGRSEWMDIDWQQHLRWVRVEDRWINLVDIGEGPVLLFVHGLSGCWQNWLENIPFFARDHRVIAIDLPGFGESEMPAKKITPCGSSATRWAASSARSSRSATRPGSSGWHWWRPPA